MGSIVFMFIDYTEIESYFYEGHENYKCEIFLGILTIPSHSHLRKFMRNSWIKDLPTNVCYAFLYDNSKYIPKEEQKDSISINATYEGKGVKFGEKLYKFYSFIINNTTLRNVRYVVKMDDDLVLCPKHLFNYLNQKLTPRSYLGWFHNMDTWKSKVDFDHRSDEMFVLLGRQLIENILSKPYCEYERKEICDAFDQRFDTNYGGTSLGLWLSEMDDVHSIPMNDMFQHSYSKKILKQENRLLFHAVKSPSMGRKIYLHCKKITL